MDYLDKWDKIKISLLLALMLAIIILFSKVSMFYVGAESFVKDSGSIKGPLIFSAVMILLILITPFPISPFAFIGGIVFGHLLGFITTLASATIGACIAFLIGRYVLHKYIAKKFKKHPIYIKMLQEEHKHLLKFIFISRIRPRTPFELISYTAGTTTMKIEQFALATLLGMLPYVFILTFFGTVIENYRITAVILFSVAFIGYTIYKIIINKRYYIRGY